MRPREHLEALSNSSFNNTSWSEGKVRHKKNKLRCPNFCSGILKQPQCFGGRITPLGTLGAPPSSSSPHKLPWRISAFQDFYWSFKKPKQQIPPRRGSSYSQVPSADPPSLCLTFKGKHPAGSAWKQEQPVLEINLSQWYFH